LPELITSWMLVPAGWTDPMAGLTSTTTPAGSISKRRPGGSASSKR